MSIEDEHCNRCGREFSTDDPRRGEWEDFHRADESWEWVCPQCQTDLDLRVIANDLTDPKEEA
jgi:hypothetical protein